MGFVVLFEGMLNMINIKKIFSLLLCAALCVLMFAGCGKKKETILIYTSQEDYVIEDLQARLNEKFPKYEIIIEYMSTGDHAAKLLAEGKETECDITYDLEYPYLQKLDAEGYLAKLTEITDTKAYANDLLESENYIPQLRNGGAIVVNTKLLAEKGLKEPTSYLDLLDPSYKDLISMPNPKASGTGYMFLLSLVNAMGEDAAFDYFDKLSENVYQFTSSGSGPINALLQEEAAIGLSMTSAAVNKITVDNAPFKILFFDEGSPYSLYGQAIIEGKQERECVKEVFKYLAEEYPEILCSKFFPERIFEEKTFTAPNYPENIKYADMKNNTPEEKERLLAKWKY